MCLISRIARLTWSTEAMTFETTLTTADARSLVRNRQKCDPFEAADHATLAGIEDVRLAAAAASMVLTPSRSEGLPAFRNLTGTMCRHLGVGLERRGPAPRFRRGSKSRRVRAVMQGPPSCRERCCQQCFGTRRLCFPARLPRNVYHLAWGGQPVSVRRTLAGI